ncbi:Alkaline proteinase [Paramyrothecium foliicola]|nr:Alkaline proteinase [Paramyrothecium foliicola]
MPSLRDLSLLLAVLLPTVVAAPHAGNFKRQDEIIPGKYIITLKTEFNDTAVQSHIHWVEDVHRRSLSKRSTTGIQSFYNATSWHGYFGEFDDDTIKEIESSPEVAFIEPDHTMFLADGEPNDDDAVYLWSGNFAKFKRQLVTQQNAPWGLATISQRTSGSRSYLYDDSAGAESFAYVVDSGVRLDHSEFEGRAVAGHNVFTGTHEDSIGHGTHVAGTIAGKTFGVAKKAQIISVKVFQGRQSTASATLDGFNWAVNDIIAKKRASRSVINLSLGGRASPSWTAAIDAAYKAGILSVVAAGNGDEQGNPLPTSSQSPANAPNAITVGAIDARWNTASFTNYGPEVDIMAPGVQIQSAGTRSSSATQTMSGTSMACPHVAGLALYLQVKENISTPAAVVERIKALGTTGKPLPLAGIRVVSLEQAIAAPLCTRHLADLGAEVIKVERRGDGDFARHYDTRVRGSSSHFIWANRSKKSLELDVKNPDDFNALQRLLKKADVFVQNLAPGATERLGLSYEALKQHNARLIVCDISGYGSYGPMRDKKAYDLLVQSEAGMLSVTGTESEPVKVGISIADISAAMYAYSNILAAIIQRQKTGVGSRVDISMLESMVEWMGFPMYYATDDAGAPKPMGAAHAAIYPYGPFDTAGNDSVMLGVQNEREWVNLCRDVLESPDLATDSRFCNNSLRNENRDALKDIIHHKFSTLSAAEVTRRLDAAKIANAMVNDMQGVWKHKQLQARNRWTEIDSPSGLIPALLPPGRSNPSDACMEAVPTLGQHNEAILAELEAEENEQH